MGCQRLGEECSEFSCGGNKNGKCNSGDSESKRMLEYVKKCEKMAKRDAIIAFRQMVYDKAWISAADQQKIDHLAEEFLESINDD